MNTMEFEEIQQIWDSQNNRPLYTIDQPALHNRILLKKKQARRITNLSEIALIIVNLGAGSFVFEMNYTSSRLNVFMYILAAWMFASTLFLVASRIRRISRSNRFQQSMHGDLDYAISTARYQVRLSRLMHLNTLPIGIFSLFGIWEGGKSVWIGVATLIFFAFAYYVGSIEHRHYIARRRELQILFKKLEQES
jgi:hypothetical protein